MRTVRLLEEENERSDPIGRASWLSPASNGSGGGAAEGEEGVERDEEDFLGRGFHFKTT